MQGDDWERAAGKLLAAVGIRSLKERGGLSAIRLRDRLSGTGFVLSRVDIVGGIVPLGEDAVGGILGDEGGACTAFIRRRGGPCDISSGRLLEAGAIGKYAHAWLLLAEPGAGDNLMTGGFLKRNAVRFADLILCALLVNAFALVTPLFSSFVYDKILGNGITDTLWALVFGIAIIFGIDFCVRMIRVTLADRLAVESDTAIDGGIFRNILDLGANRLPGMGMLLEKYKQIVSYRDFLSSAYLLSLADVPFLFLFLFVIVAVAGPLVFVPVICGALLLVSSIVLMRFEMEHLRSSRLSGERRLSLLADVLTSRDAVVGHFFRNDLLNRWRQESVDTAMFSGRARFWRGLAASIANTVSYASFVGVLVGGVYMVEAHALTAGGLLAASMLSSRAMSSMASLVTLVLRYKEFKAAMRELNLILPAVRRTHGGASYGRLKGGIRVDTLVSRFKSDEKPVLTIPRLELQPGELVGIAGAPGAGKSTLLRLIAGVMQPDEGRVLIDDIPVQDLSHQDMAFNLGFKPQDLCLMEGTIEDNIRAGRDDLDAARLQDILKWSGLDVAFRDTGLNWKTEVGPRGSCLSGGQRQLVALARAMAGDPPILLLDEPTNGLDAPLEGRLAAQLESWRAKKTILVSTHSRAVLSVCDHIVVIGQGRVMADGPREKILVQ